MTESEKEQLRKDERDFAANLANGKVNSKFRIPEKAFHDPIAQMVVKAVDSLEQQAKLVSFDSTLRELGELKAFDKVAKGRGDYASILNPANENSDLPEAIIKELRDKIRNSAAKRMKADAHRRASKAYERGEDEILIEEDYRKATLILGDYCPPFRENLNRAAMAGTEFLEHEFPSREYLMGNWFCEADLGFVFAPRGVGKTWIIHWMIAALSKGTSMDPWKVPNPVKVCLIDGEMPPDAVQDRFKKLEVEGKKLTMLSHQMLFDVAGHSFQLGDSEHRDALLDFCIEREIKVLFIDNLSSVSNINENDNDDWLTIGDWLLDFRRRGIAVVLVHHAGRNGQMRGASRREDPAFWIMKLDDSKERTGTSEGARFVVSFTKNRNSPICPPPLDFHIMEKDGRLSVKTEIADTDALVLQTINDGVESCGEIAKELDVSSGTVSKAAKRLERDGKIRIEGNGNRSRYLSKGKK